MNLALQRTPLNYLHRQAGGKLVDFAGWEMPVQFTSILAEHQAVRKAAGIFDISHMGQIWVSGPGARATLQNLVTNDLGPLAPGKGLYALLCREDGGVIDDLYVYCLEAERFLVIANASRFTVDLAWFKSRAAAGVEIWDQPQACAAAFQGPRSAEILGAISSEALALPKNGVGEFQPLGMEMIVARTGYTGEDGFEFFGAAGHLVPLYGALLKKGALPCGLGARDTLRLEMGYRLYGQDLDEEHTALEAGLGWAVKLDKAGFIGRESLLREKVRGSRRRFMALKLQDRGVPRHGSEVVSQGEVVGTLTSGSFSPSIGIGIGMGYVPASFPKDAPLAVRIHGRDVPAEQTAPPFYRKRTEE